MAEVTKYHGVKATYPKQDGSDAVLSKVKIGEKVYDLKDKAARDIIDTIYEDYLRSTDKSELLDKIAAEATRATGEEVELFDAITKEIADREAAITQEVADRNAAIKTEIEKLDVTDEAVSGQFVTAVSEADGKITVTRAKAAEYSLAKEGTTPEGLAARYYLTKDGVKVGEYIDIAKDQFLKDATFIASATEDDKAIDPSVIVGDPYIKFTFQTTGDDKITYVAVKGLVDVYTEGNGIDITNNVITAVAKTGDKYIEVTSDGIASKGIDTAISTAVAAEAAIARAAEQANATAISNEVTRATGAEEALDGRLDVIEGEGEGSIKKAVADEAAIARAAEQANAAAISGEKTRAEGQEAAIRSEFAAADTALDGKITAEATARANADTAINNKIGAKTDASTADTVYGAINAETARATAAEEANAAAISAEETRALAAEALKEDKSALKALAYKDNATGTVPGQTITGIKATGDISGTATISMDYTATNVKSTGSVVAEGNVTLNAFTQTATAATLTKGDYTPEGTVAVATTEIEASKVVSEGTAYSITNGNAVKGADTKAKFVKKAMNIAVSTEDTEMLVISEVSDTDTTFYADAVTAAGDVTYTAPVLSGALPTFTSVKADKVGDASFTGTKAENALVTGVSYDKATANGATFGGTSVAIEVNGNYDKANQPTGTVTVTGAELAVGEITVAAKDVTVS